MKILIVKTSSLGDIIQAFGAIDYLKLQFPDAEIDWVVEQPFAELVKSHPQIHEVLIIASKAWRQELFNKQTYQQIISFRKKLKSTSYDLLFDLQGNIKSGWVTFSARAKEKIGFGWKTVPEWPNALVTHFKVNPLPHQNIREDYLSLVKSYFADQTPFSPRPIFLKLDSLQEQKLASLFQKIVNPTLVCPSAAWPNKCLSEEKLMEILKKWKREPYWFIWGNSAERELATRLAAHFSASSVLERLSLPLLQHVMSRCQLVIAMDSLPLHLCGTTSTPSFSFFGPSLASKYRPLGEQHQVIQGPCPYGVKFEKRCPKLRTCSTGACLKDIEIFSK